MYSAGTNRNVSTMLSTFVHSCLALCTRLRTMRLNVSPLMAYALVATPSFSPLALLTSDALLYACATATVPKSAPGGISFGGLGFPMGSTYGSRLSAPSMTTYRFGTATSFWNATSPGRHRTSLSSPAISSFADWNNRLAYAGMRFSAASTVARSAGLSEDPAGGRALRLRWRNRSEREPRRARSSNSRAGFDSRTSPP